MKNCPLTVFISVIFAVFEFRLAKFIFAIFSSANTLFSSGMIKYLAPQNYVKMFTWNYYLFYHM